MGTKTRAKEQRVKPSGKKIVSKDAAHAPRVSLKARPREHRAGISVPLETVTSPKSLSVRSLRSVASGTVISETEHQKLSIKERISKYAKSIANREVTAVIRRSKRNGPPLSRGIRDRIHKLQSQPTMQEVNGGESGESSYESFTESDSHSASITSPVHKAFGERRSSELKYAVSPCFR